MFYPVRTKSDLCLNNSYMNKLYEPGVMDIVNKTKQKYVPCAELVDTDFPNFQNDLINNQDAFTQQEHDEVNEFNENNCKPADDSESEEEAVLCEDSRQNIPVISTSVMLNDDLNLNMQSLNKKPKKNI